jgi:DNA-directed RNA polymerase alpha subunit
MHDQNGDRNDVRKGVTEPRLSEAFVKDLVKRHNCPITTRAVNALTAGGVDTEEKLLKLTEYDLRRAPNVGPHTAQSIVELQRRVTGDVNLRNHLLQGLNDKN